MGTYITKRENRNEEIGLVKMIENTPIAIDLFCGAGGLSLGLKEAGFKTCLGVEMDFVAYLTYTQNHRDIPVLWKDIKEIKKINPILSKMDIKPKDVDLIAGGPPCQGFSLANKKTRNERNQKNDLVYDFLRIVEEVNPKTFLLENVTGITSLNNSSIFNNLINNFERLDYNVDFFILNSANYGVPQKRKRVFIVGSNGERIKKPNPTHGPDCRKNHITVKEATIGDLPKLNPIQGSHIMKYTGDPKSEYQRKMRRNCRRVYDHRITINSKKVKRRISFIPPGASLCDIMNENMLPNDLKVICDHKSVYRRLDPEKPSVTIGNFRKAMLIHPIEDRLLSLREASRLQSFPDKYRFSGSLSSMQQLIGNAVPPMLSKAIGRSIKRVIM